MPSEITAHVAVGCPHCKCTVAAKTVGDIFQGEVDFMVSLAQCPNCRNPILAGETVEIYGDGPNDVVRSTPERLWPSPRRRLTHDAPHDVQRDFNEAQSSYDAGNYTSAAIMARRVLEGIAIDLGAQKRNLVQMLDELEKNGTITGELKDWAHALRAVGNEAAHAGGGRIRAEDAGHTLDFADALANYVYTVRKRYVAFAEQRAKAAAAGKKAPLAKKAAPSSGAVVAKKAPESAVPMKRPFPAATAAKES